jgi:hypothetical protein
MFEEAEIRIAVVPSGIVPLVWQVLEPPPTYATGEEAWIEFVPATSSGERDSSTPIAIATSARPTVSATWTARFVRPSALESGSGIDEA